MRYINIIGTSGSGKSTFSKVLAAKLKLSYIELDDLFWLDDCQQRDFADFVDALQKQIDAAPQGYVIDGNYSKLEPFKWQQIDTIIWIDLPFRQNFAQALKRALKRASTQRQLWPHSNNYETWSSLFSRDSIVWWMIKTYRQNRQRYLHLMQHHDAKKIQFIRLSSHQQISSFLAQYDS